MGSYVSYNREELKTLSLVAFKKLLENNPYYKFHNDEMWIAEYEKATGKTYKVENDAEKVAVKKPIK